MTSYTRNTYVDGTTPAISAANLNNNEAGLDALYGAWTSAAPTVTASTGTFTSVSATRRHLYQGKVCHFNLEITITTVGTASGFVQVDLPVAAAGPSVFVGRERNATGLIVYGQVLATSTQILIRDYSNTSIIGAGRIINLSGSYEIA